MENIIHILSKDVRQTLVIGDIHGRFDLIYNAFELIKMLKESVPIIYGHTPRAKPKIHRDRFGIVSAVGIDTGAEFTDILTLLQITDDGERTNFTTWHIGKNQTVPSSLFW